MNQLSHTCDAFLLTCMDFRLHLEVEKILRRKYHLTFDLFTPAGAVKNLIHPENKKDRDFILQQIEKSFNLHKIKKIILINHTDCGAYGGTKAFANEDEEYKYQINELQQAKKLLEKKFPLLTIILFIAHLIPDKDKWRVKLEKVQ
jgi:carbonic anhydrase